MTYQFIALIPIIIFILVHLFAKRATQWGKILHGRFLSVGGGVATAFVFIDILPKLSASEDVVNAALIGLFFFMEKHVYILALVGFLLFFVIDRSKSLFGKNGTFWVSLSLYALFNFFVGYAVVDENDPEVQPLILFTIAIALHYFTNDYALSRSHGKSYSTSVKWWLCISLLLGWTVGQWFVLPPAGIALVGAFIGGGVIMNVMRHELPANNPNSLGAFLISALAYTVILLFVGT